jgi:acyl-CoA synthetase (AMP-forming)/AMP-acid ligase II
MDAEGYVTIIGRKDHMIIRAGVNIYPQEIENTLMQADEISEAMVWGEPDVNSGQRICAAFVPAVPGGLTPRGAMDACRKRLEPYKWPDEVHIVESLPRNASGKLMRGRPGGLPERG